MKMKTAVRACAVTLGLGIAVIGVQLFSTFQKVDQAREAAISTWMSTNPEGGDVVSRYREFCQQGKPTSPDNRRLLSIADCAAQAGSPSLASALKSAAEGVSVPAPLSWL